MDGLACWGLLDGPGGSRKERGREVEGRGGIYREIIQCQELWRERERERGLSDAGAVSM